MARWSFLCAAVMVALILPVIAACGGLEGDPDSTGVVAVDCSLFFVEGNWSLANALLGNRTEKDIKPTLVRADAPEKPILCKREGKLYFFDGLRPGRYELAKLGITLLVYEVPDEKPSNQYDTTRDFYFNLSHSARALLSADVAAGSVTYLGRVDIIDARKSKGRGFPLDDVFLAHFQRDSLAEARALQSLRAAAALRARRKGDGNQAWVERFKALPDSALHAAPRDTILSIESGHSWWP